MNIVADDRISKARDFPSQFVLFPTLSEPANWGEQPASRISREQMDAFLNAASDNARSPHFFTPPPEPPAATAEKGLAAVVLKQAAHDLRRFRAATTRAKRELYLDDYTWIADDFSRPYRELLLKASLSGAERSATRGNKWGYYTGAPETRWNPDGRNMTLLSELRYTDPQGAVWIAPAGSVVDGASIPRYFWSIMGGPFEGKYRDASVLHDVAYEQHNRPWQDCDCMFYYAMRCSGVSAVVAKTMYYWLYMFGHHWNFLRHRGYPSADAQDPVQGFFAPLLEQN